MRGLLPLIDDVPIRILLTTPLLCLFFLGLCFWVYQSRRRRLYRHLEHFPFEE